MQTLPVYLALFLVAGVYQILVTLWALFQRNMTQLVFLLLFSAAMLIYSGVQYNQMQNLKYYVDNENHGLSDELIYRLLISVPCIIGLELMIQAFLTYKLYQEFNWIIFKDLGAGLRLKSALRDYLMFESIITFDFFLFIGFSLQFIIVVLHDNHTIEFALTIAVLPVSLLILALAIISVRKELRVGVYVFIFLCFPSLAYFFFKLIRLYTVKDAAKKYYYNLAKKSLTLFAILTIIFLIATIFCAIRCLRNFGIGLKDRHRRDFNDENSDKALFLETMSSQTGSSQDPNFGRMMID